MSKTAPKPKQNIIIQDKKSDSVIYFLAAAIFGAAFLYLRLGFGKGLNIYDEAISLLGMERLLSGELPYKDFWTIYAPGNVYFLAFLSKFFSISLISSRFISILFDSASCLFIFMSAWQIRQNYKALIPAIIAIAWFGYSPYYSRAVAPALMFAAACLFLLILYAVHKKKYILIISGVLTSACILFRHDYGFYLIVVHTLFFIYLKMFGVRFKLKMPAGCFKYYFLSFAVASLPALIYFLIVIPFPDLYEQLVSFALFSYKKSRAIAFPSLMIAFEKGASQSQSAFAIWNAIIYFSPLTLVLMALLKLFLQKKKRNPNDYAIIPALIFLVLTFYNAALIRSDLEHLLPSIMFSSLLIIFVFDKIELPQMAASLLIAAFIIFAPVFKKASLLLSDEYIFEINADKAKGIKVKEELAGDYNSALSYLHENTAPQEKIYIGAENHGKADLNDLMLYYLSERLPAVKYQELHPLVTTEKDIQELMAEEIRYRNTNVIVLRKLWTEAENFEQKSHFLDKYISNNFVTSHEDDSFIYLKRR